jgi:Family of unknown function (DUF6000)
MGLGMTGEQDLRLPNDDDPELVALVQRFVSQRRRYLQLVHGNFLQLQGHEGEAFTESLAHDAGAITDAELDILLSSEWRSRLTASWLIASSRRARFVDQLGDMLLESQLVYAGQGYCIALASIGGAASATRLSEYLDRWLPEIDSRYDQLWAMAALICIDDRAASAQSARFLKSDGLWESWTRHDADLDEHVGITRSLLDAIRHGEGGSA